MDETIEHLVKNVDGFTEESGSLLRDMMNEAYPLAQIDPTENDFARVADVSLPDEGDRHVLAAAIAADTDIICTANTKDFPAAITSSFDLEVLTPDELLVLLISSYPEKRLNVHQMTIERLPNATNESTINALKQAGSLHTSELMRFLLEHDPWEPGSPEAAS